MALVAICENPAILPGQVLTDCPAADTTFQELSTLYGSGLEYVDAMELLAAAAAVWALAWGLKRVANLMRV